MAVLVVVGFQYMSVSILESFRIIRFLCVSSRQSRKFSAIVLEIEERMDNAFSGLCVLFCNVK
jgi:hypothetical protein